MELKSRICKFNFYFVYFLHASVFIDAVFVGFGGPWFEYLITLRKFSSNQNLNFNFPSQLKLILKPNLISLKISHQTNQNYGIPKLIIP